MNLSRRRCFSSPKGFTLLEIVLALTLIALFMGSLFAIVRGSIVATVEIEKVQHEDQEWNRFIKLCRQTFESLPSTAGLTLTSQSQGLAAYQELTISGMPECLAFGVSPYSYEDTILALKPEQVQEGETAHYFLGLHREDLIPKESARAQSTINETTSLFSNADEQGRLWLPLIRDLQQLQWRFYDESSQTWKEVWEETTLPPLVELTVLKREATVPYRMVFAIRNEKLTQNTGGSGVSATSNSANGLGENGGDDASNGQGGNSNNQGGGRGGQGGNSNNQGGGRGGQGGNSNNQGGGRGGQGGNSNNQGGGRGGQGGNSNNQGGGRGGQGGNSNNQGGGRGGQGGASSGNFSNPNASAQPMSSSRG